MEAGPRRIGRVTLSTWPRDSALHHGLVAKGLRRPGQIAAGQVRCSVTRSPIRTMLPSWVSAPSGMPKSRSNPRTSSRVRTATLANSVLQWGQVRSVGPTGVEHFGQLFIFPGGERKTQSLASETPGYRISPKDRKCFGILGNAGSHGLATCSPTVTAWRSGQRLHAVDDLHGTGPCVRRC